MILAPIALFGSRRHIQDQQGRGPPRSSTPNGRWRFAARHEKGSKRYRSDPILLTTPL